MQKTEGFKNTRFFQLCMAHPYAVAFGCGFLALGAATGASTCAALGCTGLASGCAGQPVHAGAGLLRMALLNVMLCCGVLGSLFWPSFFPLSCLSLTLKGFALGFAVEQCRLDYGWAGLLFAFPGIMLPSFCMLTGLILCFGQGAAEMRSAQGRERPRGDDAMNRSLPIMKLTVFLTGLAVILEGWIGPFILRILIS